MPLTVHRLEEDDDGEGPGSGGVAARVTEGLAAGVRADQALCHVWARVVVRQLKISDEHFIQAVDREEVEVLLPCAEHKAPAHQDKDLFGASKVGECLPVLTGRVRYSFLYFLDSVFSDRVSKKLFLDGKIYADQYTEEYDDGSGPEPATGAGLEDCSLNLSVVSLLLLRQNTREAATIIVSVILIYHG